MNFRKRSQCNDQITFELKFVALKEVIFWFKNASTRKVSIPLKTTILLFAGVV